MAMGEYFRPISQYLSHLEEEVVAIDVSSISDFDEIVVDPYVRMIRRASQNHHHMDDPESYADEAIEDHDMHGEGQYNDDEYDEGEDGLFNDEDDDEDDEDAEAVAKRLGDALWADISKAYAQRASEPVQPSDNQALSPSQSVANDEQSLEDAIRTVLDLASGNTALNNVLSVTLIPGTDDQTLLNILAGTAEAKEISPGLADTLSDLVQSIADGDLFVDAAQS